MPLSSTPRSFVPAALALSAGLAVACSSNGPVSSARVSGFVEADDVQVSAEVGGRVVELNVDEGDRVDAGAVIVRLDTRDTELALTRARAERAQAEAQLRLLEAGSRPEEIRQAEAQVAVAEADVRAAEAELASAASDLDRYEALLRANAGSVKARDDARTRRDVAEGRLAAARQRVEAARETLARLRRGARSQEIEAARARVAAADAQIATLGKALDDATVEAPVGGVVTSRLVNLGELLAPRAPIVVITDLDHAWAEVFVDEPLVPRLRLGQQATVYTDAGGGGIEGKVTYISPRAEFTPRNVQTAEERSRLVYRVKVTVDNREGVLKPGMPVEAELPLAGQ
jgi:HlyD family secretion protein